ncbi:reverse transcriptase zinc-binding domain-containing protein [Artemisia annua]|uniref:Reverse transcriptase zinc-binding domain-containing protein n=1 Tax=Artemisia annua TaxID=35608 RepID=A0A2U1PD99_ARTAN|nr:reverse transcriptase zinc-binding domain-containing protein [Artemisia annua]
MWHDLWHNIGPLSHIVPMKSIFDARLKNEYTVADMVENNSWIWPQDWYARFPMLSQVQVPTFDANIPDTVKWRSKNGLMCEYSTKEGWKELKEDKPIVPWWKTVWFSQCNPKNAFTLWMAFQKRLLTQDRMVKWCSEVLLCPLCKKTNDSHNHLFFLCEFSSKVWSVMKNKMKVDVLPNDWDQITHKIASLPCNNSIWSILNRIIIATTVYGIWKERNERLFKLKTQSTEVIIQCIIEQIRMQLLSLTVKKSTHTIKVADQWNIQFKYVQGFQQ